MLTVTDPPRMLAPACAAAVLTVNSRGYAYTTSGTSIGQELCPEDTYGPGFKKQRACAPCASGFTTDGLTARWRPDQCGECH